MKIKIGIKDRKILYQLDINARQSNSRIAKKTGLSKDVVNYRIRKMEESGLIKGYYTVIDFYRMAYLSIRVYLKFIDVDLEKEKEIIDFLVNHRMVFYVAETEGYTDISLGVLAKSIYDFESFYNLFKEKFKQHLHEENIAIFTKAFQFHRAYLIDKKIDDIEPEVVGHEYVLDFDKKDIEILKLLAPNSRIPIVEIAKKLHMPTRTVAFRIRRMEKKKIIQGYRFIFDFGLIGYDYYKADLTLRDVSRVEKLVKFCHNHPNILYIDRTIGGSDFEFDMEVRGKEEFLKVMTLIRSQFPEIRDWKFFSVRKYSKLVYFPEN